MPNIIIDNLTIDVPKGTKVIEAAEQLGIIIPRFCFHPALGSLGACRMCAVKFLEGPVKGIEMSCMEQARDGMVISTADAEVVDFRRQVIEWLMINHPHDCPVCDEGGHCLLQDLTVAGGHGRRRFFNPKRTYYDQNLGTLIQHEMNRCIHCYRCRRFYQEFAGYRDFGALGIGDRTYLGRFKDGPLENPFSGNIIDLCPTGVLTDKPSRYKGRRWDFERGPSLCLHCSLGCRVVTSVRYREVVRQEAGFNNKVNGYFICDRGRYGFDYANHPERPRRARIGLDEVPLDQTLQAAAKKISSLIQKFGKESVACQGSSRSPLETQAMLKGLCRTQGWPEPGYLIDPLRERAIHRAVSRTDARISISLREIEQADFILVVGADPINEAPLSALALRQAFRTGASIVVIDPRPVFLPLNFETLTVGPDELDLCLGVILKKAVNPSTAEKKGTEALRFYEALPDTYTPDPLINNRLMEIAQGLKQSHRPVLICGTDIVRPATPALAADLILLLQAQEQQAGLFYLLPGANSFGAALLSSPGRSFLKTLEEIEKGSIACLILIETDPFRFFPDRYRLEEALNKLDCLLVLDYLPSASVRQAHFFLPTQTVFEAGGHFINQEGRVQWAPPIYHGGLPIKQVCGGGHPPRQFRQDIPGGEPRPAWNILSELSHLLSPGSDLSLDTLWTELAHENPIFSPLQGLNPPEDEIRLFSPQTGENLFSLTESLPPDKKVSSSDQVELLLVEWTFATEELSTYSEPIREMEEKPRLTISTEEGIRLGLQKGDRAILSLDGGPLEVAIDLNDHLAAGVMILPRHEQLAWQKITDFPIRLTPDRIQKSRGRI